MDSATSALEKYEELQAYIDALPDKKGRLIGVLHRAQEIFGYLPREVQEYVANALTLPLSKVYGVVKFYAFFTMTPKGRFPVSVCLGTACYVRGGGELVAELEKHLGIKVGEVTPDGLFSISTLRCIGTCGLAPVMTVAGDVYGRLKPSEVKGILEGYRQRAEAQRAESGLEKGENGHG